MRCLFRFIAGAACVAVSSEEPTEESRGATVISRDVMLGIGELADELGVHRQSIWAVMKGTRTSHRLHDELKARGFKPAALPARKRKGKPARKDAAPKA